MLRGAKPERQARQLKLRSRITGGLRPKVWVGLTVFDTSGPAEAGPPPHRHPWEEIYVVLSGQLEVTVDGQP